MKTKTKKLKEENSALKYDLNLLEEQRNRLRDENEALRNENTRLIHGLCLISMSAIKVADGRIDVEITHEGDEIILTGYETKDGE